MSGNHNAKAKSAKLTKLERVCEEVADEMDGLRWGQRNERVYV